MVVESGCETCDGEVKDSVEEIFEDLYDCHMNDVDNPYKARDAVVYAAEDLGKELGEQE